MKIKITDWRLWLIQSTLGGHVMYPANRCSFIKLFALSLIAFPFAIHSHIVNLCRRENEMHAGWGALCMIIGTIISIGIMNPKDGLFHWEWYDHLGTSLPTQLNLAKIGICYLMSPITLTVALLIIAAIIAVVGVVGWLGEKIWDKLKTKKKSKEEKKETLMGGYVKDLKNRYCTNIEYIEKDGKIFAVSH